MGGDQHLPQQHVFRAQRRLQDREILGIEGPEETVVQVSLTEMDHGCSCIAGASASGPAIINAPEVANAVPALMSGP